MFDVGLFELVVLAIVTLLVVGPERLPEVVRTLGRWVGRVKSLANGIKAEIDREIQAEELKQLTGSLSDSVKEMRGELENSIGQGLKETQAEIGELSSDLGGGPIQRQPDIPTSMPPQPNSAKGQTSTSK